MDLLFKFFALIFGALALSTSAIFVKLADAPAAITAFYRLLFTLLVLGPFVLASKNYRLEMCSLSSKQRNLSLISGSLLAVHYIIWFESLNYTSVASSTVLVTLQPVFSMLLGYLFVKERHTSYGYIGCAIALIGSFIIGYGDFQASGLALLGDAMALLAAAIISGYFFFGQKLRQSMSALAYSVLGYIGSVSFLAIYALLKQDSFTGYSDLTWQCFIGVALVSTVMGQFIFNLLLKWFSATTISMAILGEPIGTCIMAYFILGEIVNYRQMLGMGIIIMGLGLYFYSLKLEKNSQN